MSIPKNNIDDSFKKRWICIVHVKLPSSVYDDDPPDAIGAFVPIVADAQTKGQFIDAINDTLGRRMGYSILEIEDIELLPPDRKLGKDVEDSIKNLLPHFPIAFGDFNCYTSED